MSREREPSPRESNRVKSRRREQSPKKVSRERQSSRSHSSHTRTSTPLRELSSERSTGRSHVNERSRERSSSREGRKEKNYSIEPRRSRIRERGQGLLTDPTQARYQSRSRMPDSSETKINVRVDR